MIPMTLTEFELPYYIKLERVPSQQQLYFIFNLEKKYAARFDANVPTLGQKSSRNKPTSG